jgi:hypothetical protein
MEEDHDERQRPAARPSAQAREAATNHLDWRCDHWHDGPGDAKLGAASGPHRHAPTQQTSLDLGGDLLGATPVHWVIEWAGPDLRCRGIEVTRRDTSVALGGWVADPGDPRGDEPVAARLRRWL